MVYHSVSTRLSLLKIIEVEAMIGGGGFPQQSGSDEDMEFVLMAKESMISSMERVERRVLRKLKRRQGDQGEKWTRRGGFGEKLCMACVSLYRRICVPLEPQDPSISHLRYKYF